MGEPVMDLYAKLTKGVGLNAPKTAPAGAVSQTVSTAAVAAAVAKRPSAKPPANTGEIALPKNDPVNAPERPATVAAPAKGMDLLAHLQAQGVAAPASAEPAAPAVVTAQTVAVSDAPKTDAPAKAKTVPPAAPKAPKTTKAESKAKLEAMLANPEVSDEQLGAAVRTIAQFLVSLAK